MIIAVDAREMVGTVVGKSRYLVELIKALGEIDKTNKYILYSKAPITLELPDNFTNQLIGGLPGFRQLWLALDAKSKNADLLFAPTGYLPVFFSIIPCVVTIHDLAIFITKDAKPSFKTLVAERLLLRLAVKKAKAVLAVSRSTKADLHRLFNVPIQKIHVSLLGYDSALYHPRSDRDQMTLSKFHLPEKYLLFIGTLEPRKNLVNLIQAFSQLPPPLQAEFPLVIAGKKGWYFNEIFATVERLKLDKVVRFLGRVEDEALPALYRQATLFLFPSFYEGFGLPPLESMACGTPVVSSNISSLPEVIDKAGLLVDPTNPDQIMLAIEQLLTDDKLYKKVALETTQQAKKFTWAETARVTLAIFEKVAGR